MNGSRQSSKADITLRGNRVFIRGKSWYFLCRERGPSGPYKSKKSAELALMRYLNTMQVDETNPATIKLFEIS